MTEDIVAAFQLEGAPVRGRWARLAANTIDPILRRHAYPRPVALLLGEALTLAGLIAALFKVEGRLTLQAEGAGPVSLLVAEAGLRTGTLRGYARFTELAEALAAPRALAPGALLGAGVLTLSLDQGPDAPLMQGVVELEGDTLAACLEAYFRRSEQTPTIIRAAVGEDATPGQAAVWRSGAALIQRVAGDAVRGSSEEAWEEAQALFATLSDHELIDPALPMDRALYRLFHENGVRLAPGLALADVCSCSGERLAALFARLPAEDLAPLREEDGALRAECQFCGRTYLLDPPR